MKIVNDNILNAKEQYIAHQCNCLTVRSYGLAQTIAKAYPWSDHYRKRKALDYQNCAIEEDRDLPGTIAVYESYDKMKIIICMFAQYAPSKPQKYKQYPNYEIDTYDNRIIWFKECLNEIEKLNPKSIAFPWMIGCGLAGGDWNTYYKILEDWEKNTKILVSLYKLD